jgi:hypothetical protein
VYDSLKVTRTGQVFTCFADEKTVPDLSIELANSKEAERTAFWANNSKDSCLNMLKNLIKLDEAVSSPVVECIDTIERGHYVIKKIKITESNLTPITGLFFIPKKIKQKLPAILYVDGRGKITDATVKGPIEQFYVDSSKIVFAIDVRGFGETTDNPALNESKHGNNEHRNAVISLYIGKTLIGQRVEDIKKAMDYLITCPEVNPDSISIIGIGRAGTSVLHAATLDDRYVEVVVRNTDTSWMNIIEAPTILNNMTHMVPSAMMYYDLPNLVDAISPDKVKYNPAEYVLPVDIEIYNPSEDDKILGQNQPNPFQTETSISYTNNEPGHVLLIVYDSNGKKVKTLVNRKENTGTHSIVFRPESLKSGNYYYQLTLDGKQKMTKKMLIIN